MARPTTFRAFPSNIVRFDRGDFRLGRRVGVECLSNAVYAQHAPSNTRWIYKTDMHAGGVLAEALGWLICDDLRIPIPRAAAVREPGSAVPDEAWAFTPRVETRGREGIL